MKRSLLLLLLLDVASAQSATSVSLAPTLAVAAVLVAMAISLLVVVLAICQIPSLRRFASTRQTQPRLLQRQAGATELANVYTNESMKEFEKRLRSDSPSEKSAGDERRVELTETERNKQEQQNAYETEPLDERQVEVEVSVEPVQQEEIEEDTVQAIQQQQQQQHRLPDESQEAAVATRDTASQFLVFLSRKWDIEQHQLEHQAKSQPTINDSHPQQLTTFKQETQSSGRRLLEMPKVFDSIFDSCEDVNEEEETENHETASTLKSQNEANLAMSQLELTLSEY